MDSQDPVLKQNCSKWIVFSAILGRWPTIDPVTNSPAMIMATDFGLKMTPPLVPSEQHT
jgi:hypothetical protein